MVCFSLLFLLLELPALETIAFGSGTLGDASILELDGNNYLFDMIF